MLKLPEVTIICLTNQKFPDHLEAMRNSSEEIEFGARKIIFDMDCDSIDKWNEKIIKELPNYVQTSHALLIHSDGYVINPELWNPEWLQYDYIGAPWPLPQDDYSYLDEEGELVRVGNSVSLRSKKLMGLVATRPMESQGCKFAPLDVAVHFSKEHTIPENEGLETFAFHALG